jgi:hypothetical protein
MASIHDLLGQVNQHLADFKTDIDKDRKMTKTSVTSLISLVVRGRSDLTSELGKLGRGTKKKVDPILQKKLNTVLETIEVVQAKQVAPKNSKIGVVLANFWLVLDELKKEARKAVKSKPAKVERKTKSQSTGHEK